MSASGGMLPGHSTAAVQLGGRLAAMDTHHGALGIKMNSSANTFAVLTVTVTVPLLATCALLLLLLLHGSGPSLNTP